MDHCCFPSPLAADKILNFRNGGDERTGMPVGCPDYCSPYVRLKAGRGCYCSTADVIWREPVNMATGEEHKLPGLMPLAMIKAVFTAASQNGQNTRSRRAQIKRAGAAPTAVHAP